MGWASGSSLFGDIIETVQDNVEDENTRFDIYVNLISAFINSDCDTLYECLGQDSAFDKAYSLYYDEDEDN